MPSLSDDPMGLLRRELRLDKLTEPAWPEIATAIRTLETILPTIEPDVTLPREGAEPEKTVITVCKLLKCCWEHKCMEAGIAWGIWRLAEAECLTTSIWRAQLESLPTQDDLKEIWRPIARLTKRANKRLPADRRLPTETPASMAMLIPCVIPTALFKEWPKLITPAELELESSWPAKKGWDFREGEAAFNGKRFEVSGKKELILRTLAKLKKGERLHRKILIQEVWGANASATDDGTLRGHVSQLNTLLKEQLNLKHNPITRKNEFYRFNID